MNPLKENHEIKSLADFEALINQSKTSYTGLVESVDYVYWRSEPVYLVEIGKAMYDTDYMQRGIAELFAKDYKKYSRLLDQESQLDRSNEKRMREYQIKKEQNLKSFRNCMDKLGYKY